VNIQLLHGDCVKRIAELEAASIGAAVFDPPYGLEFMGNEWDTFKEAKVLDWGPTHDKWGRVPGGGAYAAVRPRYTGKRNESLAPYQEWAVKWLTEIYRVLEPGGVVKAFSGSRTFHRLAAAMVEVGFQDVHLEAWAYGSGFPKSLNVAIGIDKAAGAMGHRGKAFRTAGAGDRKDLQGTVGRAMPQHAGVTKEARLWRGWGTALKPSWEPVLVGRKP
jgi:site-specific DNA-methyltransferase (adenine-specific)